MPPFIIGLLVLFNRERTTQLLLDAERRYGTTKSAARALTPERARYVSRFLVVWCVLCVGFSIGGFVQNL